MPKNEYKLPEGVLLKTGLWKKVSQKGRTYYSALVELAGSKYWVNLFSNEKKTSAAAPDLELVIQKAGNAPAKKETKSDDIPF